MKIGIVGAGEVGATIGRLLSASGHDVAFSWSRDPARLSALAAEVPHAVAVEPSEAVAFGDVVIFSVRFEHVDAALTAAGSLSGKFVIDTCNPYTPDRNGDQVDLGGLNESQYMAARLPGARYVKAFNTLTAGFLADAAGRVGDNRVVLFLSGDDAEAKEVAAGLVTDTGLDPFDLGGIDDSAQQQPGGKYYGEEFHLRDLNEEARWPGADSRPPSLSVT